MQPIKIGKYEIKYPIIQGGMGLGISWDKLAGSVSLEGGLGVISSVGTGYWQSQMPLESKASRHESMMLLRVAYLLLVNGLLASLVAGWSCS